MTERRPRVALFSPLRPDPSGVSDYSEELLPHLDRHFGIDLFVDGYAPEAEAARGHRVIDVARTDPLPLLPAYDAVLYHIGNSPSHIYAYETFLRHPGLVVLHDCALPHLMVERTLGRGRRDRFLAELRAQHGDRAAEAARRHFYGGEDAPWDADPLRYPMNRRILERARAVLVHSRFAARALRSAGARCPVETLDHHVAKLDPPAALRAPRDSSSPLSILTAGFLTPAKRIETVLHALARLRRRIDFRYHLVGSLPPGYRLGVAVAQRGLRRRVLFHGPVTKPELYRQLRRADVCVNLRQPTHGETSGMVLRALACERPVIVSDDGWFGELPDACVVKIAPGADEVGTLSEALYRLAASPERREALAAAARRYAEERDPASRARGYRDFVRRRIPQRPDPQSALARSVEAEVRSLELDPETLEIPDLFGGRARPAD